MTIGLEGQRLQVCVDCVGVIANDDYTSLDLLSDEESATTATRIREGIRWWRSNGYTLVLTGAEDEFVTRPCDLCRSPLAGQRLEVEVIEIGRNTTNNKQEEEMKAVPTTPEVDYGRAITGFGVWQEDGSTQLFCPPCFIDTDINPDENIYSDKVDWLHPGGPQSRCVRCGRLVN